MLLHLWVGSFRHPLRDWGGDTKTLPYTSEASLVTPRNGPQCLRMGLLLGAG